MKILCKYAVLRFMPFAETQEFANIGIVLSVPKQGFIVYKLANTRFARVTNFFDDLDGQLYKNAVNRFTSELHRVQAYAQDLQHAIPTRKYRGWELFFYREFGGTKKLRHSRSLCLIFRWFNFRGLLGSSERG